jgi:hypothetical protein
MTTKVKLRPDRLTTVKGVLGHLSIKWQPGSLCYRIQHDNTGFGAGWFLDRVVVTDLQHPKKWKFFFPCGQWLAKDEGDGLICRDLIGSTDPLAIRKGGLGAASPGAVPEAGPEHCVGKGGGSDLGWGMMCSWTL